MIILKEFRYMLRAPTLPVSLGIAYCNMKQYWFTFQRKVFAKEDGDDVEFPFFIGKKYLRHILEFSFRKKILICFLILVFPDFAWSQKEGLKEDLKKENRNYILSPNDVIEFRVFQETDMDSTLRISEDGSTTFPLIGTITLGGKTVAQAIELLRRRYMDGYLLSPQISITIKEYARRRFTILGQVQRPGSYELLGNEGIGLLQAIGMAGGYTRIANPKDIVVKRRQRNQESILRFDANRMAKSTSDSNFLIKAGDIVTVGESIF